jgi:hypothetical protein
MGTIWRRSQWERGGGKEAIVLGGEYVQSILYIYVYMYENNTMKPFKKLLKMEGGEEGLKIVTVHKYHNKHLCTSTTC